MRLRRRFITALAALFILQGTICPAVCFDAPAQQPTDTHVAENQPTTPPPCHKSSSSPVNGSSEPGNEQAECSHCEAPVLVASANLEFESTEVAIAIARVHLAPQFSHAAVYANAPSHDPPPEDLVLLKNSFLL